MQPSQPYPDFFTMQFSEHEIKQNSTQILNFFPFAAITDCQNSHKLSSSLPQNFTLFQLIFTRRTSRHCTRTFRAINALYL
jgi:hypothetical protein